VRHLAGREQLLGGRVVEQLEATLVGLRHRSSFAAPGHGRAVRWVSLRVMLGVATEKVKGRSDVRAGARRRG
jgi:hypothetical protein